MVTKGGHIDFMFLAPAPHPSAGSDTEFDEYLDPLVYLSKVWGASNVYGVHVSGATMYLGSQSI